MGAGNEERSSTKVEFINQLTQQKSMKGIPFEGFIEQIMEYESDTFSASASQITPDEARDVARVILAIWIDDHLDGVRIDAVLDGLRSHDDD